MITAITDRLDKRRVATLMKRAPWIGYIGQRVWRLSQPWVTVGSVGVIFDDAGRLLLVEHVFHPEFPWGLPGGWMMKNEDPGETVRREVLEETGLHVEIVKPLLAAHTMHLSRHLDMAYLCLAKSGATPLPVTVSSELLGFQWVNPLTTPPLVPFHRQAIAAALRERTGQPPQVQV